MNWPIVKIGDYCDLMTGGTPSTKVSDYYNGGDIPWIASGDIHRANIYDTDKKITQQGMENSPAKYLPKDSVLIALNGQGKTRGTVAMLRIDNATCNQSVISINPKNSTELDSYFLFQILRSMYQKIRNITGDKDRAGLNMRLINGIEFPLPPIKEQKRIAEILDQADALCQSRRRAITCLNDLSQSIFYEMFGDVSVNEKKWNLVKCKDVLKLQGGFAFKSANYQKSGIPIVRIGEVNTNFQKEYVFYPETEKLSKYMLKPGDLVISLTGTVGKDDYCNTAIVPNTYEKFYLNQRVAKIICIPEKLNFRYFQYLISIPKIKADIIKNNRGIRQANISNNDIYNLEIPLPDISLQSKFFDYLEKINKQRLKLESTLIELENLFLSLQQRAFRGEL